MKKAIYTLVFLTNLAIFASCGKDQPTVVACFEIADDTVAVSEPITFKNCSLFGKSYLWNFGDGYGSENFEPAYAFDKAGAYTVRLSVYGQDDRLDQVYTRIVVKTIEAK